ncbi:MAG: hypothetical protein HSCHL_2364 [Hydrogenibacillus schlegelii]|uniref:Uncharacterized protein n=1 Tax=Hydrogenibacillus schlegelii TaxID=1484 RepID=A0A2T5GF11_HYDSH|nr:MAG: hypothetical protein HSCHL_2364 [Hydrogenibacillus schlegelii]
MASGRDPSEPGVHLLPGIEVSARAPHPERPRFSHTRRRSGQALPFASNLHGGKPLRTPPR